MFFNILEILSFCDVLPADRAELDVVIDNYNIYIQFLVSPPLIWIVRLQIFPGHVISSFLVIFGTMTPDDGLDVAAIFMLCRWTVSVPSGCHFFV